MMDREEEQDDICALHLFWDEHCRQRETLQTLHKRQNREHERPPIFYSYSHDRHHRSSSRPRDGGGAPPFSHHLPRHTSSSFTQGRTSLPLDKHYLQRYSLPPPPPPSFFPSMSALERGGIDKHGGKREGKHHNVQHQAQDEENEDTKQMVGKKEKVTNRVNDHPKWRIRGMKVKKEDEGMEGKKKRNEKERTSLRYDREEWKRGRFGVWAAAAEKEHEERGTDESGVGKCRERLKVEGEGRRRIATTKNSTINTQRAEEEGAVYAALLGLSPLSYLLVSSPSPSSITATISNASTHTLRCFPGTYRRDEKAEGQEVEEQNDGFHPSSSDGTTAISPSSPFSPSSSHSTHSTAPLPPPVPPTDPTIFTTDTAATTTTTRTMRRSSFSSEKDHMHLWNDLEVWDEGNHEIINENDQWGFNRIGRGKNSDSKKKREDEKKEREGEGRKKSKWDEMIGLDTKSLYSIPTTTTSLSSGSSFFPFSQKARRGSSVCAGVKTMTTRAMTAAAAAAAAAAVAAVIGVENHERESDLLSTTTTTSFATTRARSKRRRRWSGYFSPTRTATEEYTWLEEGGEEENMLDLLWRRRRSTGTGHLCHGEEAGKRPAYTLEGKKKKWRGEEERKKARWGLEFFPSFTRHYSSDISATAATGSSSSTTVPFSFFASDATTASIPTTSSYPFLSPPSPSTSTTTPLGSLFSSVSHPPDLSSSFSTRIVGGAGGGRTSATAHTSSTNIRDSRSIPCTRTRWRRCTIPHVMYSLPSRYSSSPLSVLPKDCSSRGWGGGRVGDSIPLWDTKGIDKAEENEEEEAKRRGEKQMSGERDNAVFWGVQEGSGIYTRTPRPICLPPPPPPPLSFSFPPFSFSFPPISITATTTSTFPSTTASCWRSSSLLSCSSSSAGAAGIGGGRRNFSKNISLPSRSPPPVPREAQGGENEPRVPQEGKNNKKVVVRSDGETWERKGREEEGAEMTRHDEKEEEEEGEDLNRRGRRRKIPPPPSTTTTTGTTADNSSNTKDVDNRKESRNRVCHLDSESEIHEKENTTRTSMMGSIKPSLMGQSEEGVLCITSTTPVPPPAPPPPLLSSSPSPSPPPPPPSFYSYSSLHSPRSPSDLSETEAPPPPPLSRLRPSGGIGAHFNTKKAGEKKGGNERKEENSLGSACSESVEEEDTYVKEEEADETEKDEEGKKGQGNRVGEEGRRWTTDTTHHEKKETKKEEGEERRRALTTTTASSSTSYSAAPSSWRHDKITPGAHFTLAEGQIKMVRNNTPSPPYAPHRLEAPSPVSPPSLTPTSGKASDEDGMGKVEGRSTTTTTAAAATLGMLYPPSSNDEDGWRHPHSWKKRAEDRRGNDKSEILSFSSSISECGMQVKTSPALQAGNVDSDKDNHEGQRQHQQQEEQEKERVKKEKKEEEIIQTKERREESGKDFEKKKRKEEEAMVMTMTKKSREVHSSFDSRLELDKHVPFDEHTPTRCGGAPPVPAFPFVHCGTTPPSSAPAGASSFSFSFSPSPARTNTTTNTTSSCCIAITPEGRLLLSSPGRPKGEEEEGREGGGGSPFTLHSSLSPSFSPFRVSPPPSWISGERRRGGEGESERKEKKKGGENRRSSHGCPTTRCTSSTSSTTSRYRRGRRNSEREEGKRINTSTTAITSSPHVFQSNVGRGGTSSSDWTVWEWNNEEKGMRRAPVDNHHSSSHGRQDVENQVIQVCSLPPRRTTTTRALVPAPTTMAGMSSVSRNGSMPRSLPSPEPTSPVEGIMMGEMRKEEEKWKQGRKRKGEEEEERKNTNNHKSKTGISRGDEVGAQSMNIRRRRSTRIGSGRKIRRLPPGFTPPGYPSPATFASSASCTSSSHFLVRSEMREGEKRGNNSSRVKQGRELGNLSLCSSPSPSFPPSPFLPHPHSSFSSTGNSAVRVSFIHEKKSSPLHHPAHQTRKFLSSPPLGFVRTPWSAELLSYGENNKKKKKHCHRHPPASSSFSSSSRADPPHSATTTSRSTTTSAAAASLHQHTSPIRGTARRMFPHRTPILQSSPPVEGESHRHHRVPRQQVPFFFSSSLPVSPPSSISPRPSPTTSPPLVSLPFREGSAPLLPPGPARPLAIAASQERQEAKWKSLSPTALQPAPLSLPPPSVTPATGAGGGGGAGRRKWMGTSTTITARERGGREEMSSTSQRVKPGGEERRIGRKKIPVPSVVTPKAAVPAAPPTIVEREGGGKPAAPAAVAVPPSNLPPSARGRKVPVLRRASHRAEEENISSFSVSSCSSFPGPSPPLNSQPSRLPSSSFTPHKLSGPPPPPPAPVPPDFTLFSSSTTTNSSLSPHHYHDNTSHLVSFQGKEEEEAAQRAGGARGRGWGAHEMTKAALSSPASLSRTNIPKIPLKKAFSLLTASPSLIGWYPPPSPPPPSSTTTATPPAPPLIPRLPVYVEISIQDRVTTVEGIQVQMPHLVWRRVRRLLPRGSELLMDGDDDDEGDGGGRGREEDHQHHHGPKKRGGGGGDGVSSFPSPSPSPPPSSVDAVVVAEDRKHDDGGCVNLTDIRRVSVFLSEGEEEEDEKVGRRGGGAPTTGVQSSFSSPTSSLLSSPFLRYGGYFYHHAEGTTTTPPSSLFHHHPLPPLPPLRNPEGKPMDAYWLAVVEFYKSSSSSSPPLSSSSSSFSTGGGDNTTSAPPLVICFLTEKDRQRWVGGLMGVAERNTSLRVTPAAGKVST